MYHIHFLRNLRGRSKLACNHRKRKVPDPENSTQHRSKENHRSDNKYLYSEAPRLLLCARHRRHFEVCHHPTPHSTVQPFQHKKNYRRCTLPKEGCKPKEDDKRSRKQEIKSRRKERQREVPW